MADRAGLSWRFGRAIVRLPGRSVVDGLRDVDRGQPDLAVYREEHAAYVRALEEAGVAVETLPALEAFPDSVFVEDTALCLPEGIVVLRPGAPSRRGEADAMAMDCKRLGHRVQRLRDSGRIDGGDILVTDREILVGESDRTDRNGFEALAEIVGAWGYSIRLVRTPAQVLHFKSDCAVLGPDAILATYRLSGEPCFGSCQVLEVPRGEEAAANCIRVNDTVLVPGGYPRTAEMLHAAGFCVKTVPATQAALLDGGLSCQSLRF